MRMDDLHATALLFFMAGLSAGMLTVGLVEILATVM